MRHEFLRTRVELGDECQRLSRPDEDQKWKCSRRRSDLLSSESIPVDLRDLVSPSNLSLSSSLIDCHDVTLGEYLRNAEHTESLRQRFASVPEIFKDLSERNTALQVKIDEKRFSSMSDFFLGSGVGTPRAIEWDLSGLQHSSVLPSEGGYRSLLSSLDRTGTDQWNETILSETSKAISLFSLSARLYEILLPKGKTVSVIWSGDFNTNVSSLAFELLFTGALSIDPTHRSYNEGKVYSLWIHFNEVSRLDYATLIKDFRYQSPVNFSTYSAYAYTHYKIVFHDVIDHIFFESKRFRFERSIPMPTHEEVTEFQAIPSRHIPSDHLAVVLEVQMIEWTLSLSFDNKKNLTEGTLCSEFERPLCVTSFTHSDRSKQRQRILLLLSFDFHLINDEQTSRRLRSSLSVDWWDLSERRSRIASESRVWSDQCPCEKRTGVGEESRRGGSLRYHQERRSSTELEWEQQRFVVLLDIVSSSAIDGKQGLIYEGKPKEGTSAQVTITVDDADFVQLAQGKANAPAVCSTSFVSVVDVLVFFLSSCSPKANWRWKEMWCWPRSSLHSSKINPNYNW